MELVLPEVDVLIWSIINFAILYYVLRRFAWEPIITMMESREEEIESSLNEAKSANEEAQRLKAEYEQQLAEAQREARRVIEQATARGEETRQEMIEESRQEAAKMLQEAEASIEREKQAAISELRQEVADLAVLAAGRVLEREIDDEDQLRFAENFVDEVGGLQ